MATIKSIEEKAKRYDEAIEKFDVILNLNTVKESGTIFADDVRKILPELKESEDERIRKAMIDFFKHEREEGITVLHYGVNIESMIDWLEKGAKGNEVEIPNSEPPLTIKHAREVMGIKQDPAWSEEDEETIDNLIDYLENEFEISYMKEDKEGFRSQINLLKSLKDRFTWKPSDEQMDALAAAVSSLQSTSLESLYQDLKRL